MEYLFKLDYIFFVFQILVYAYLRYRSLIK
jgi:hypothetical protein